MVGQLRFPDGRVAILTNEGAWKSLDPLLAADLTLNYDPNRIGPANMPFGECAVQLAADVLGARAEFAAPVATIPKGAV